MAKGYVPIFFDWMDNTQDLSAEEKGHLIDAVILYASGSDEWIDQLQTSGEKIAFRFMSGQIDRNIEISKARARAGANKQEQNETNENKKEQSESNSVKEKKKEEDKNKEKEKNKTSPLFDRFWDAYPRHVNKPGAVKAFDKAKIDEDLLEVILKAIERQKGSDQWTKDDGQFIPHPATWLNQKRWEDELPTTHQKPTVVAQDYEQRDYSSIQDGIMDRQSERIRAFMAKKQEVG